MSIDTQIRQTLSRLADEAPSIPPLHLDQQPRRTLAAVAGVAAIAICAAASLQAGQLLHRDAPTSARSTAASPGSAVAPFPTSYEFDYLSMGGAHNFLAAQALDPVRQTYVYVVDGSLHTKDYPEAFLYGFTADEMTRSAIKRLRPVMVGKTHGYVGTVGQFRSPAESTPLDKVLGAPAKTPRMTVFWPRGDGRWAALQAQITTQDLGTITGVTNVQTLTTLAAGVVSHHDRAVTQFKLSYVPNGLRFAATSINSEHKWLGDIDIAHDPAQDRGVIDDAAHDGYTELQFASRSEAAHGPSMTVSMVYNPSVPDLAHATSATLPAGYGTWHRTTINHHVAWVGAGVVLIQLPSGAQVAQIAVSTQPGAVAFPTSELTKVAASITGVTFDQSRMYSLDQAIPSSAMG